MRLKLVYLLVEIEGIATISDGSWLVFLVSTVHKYLLAIQEHYFRNVAVGKYFTWS
jgi:hypothetical protein